jgi:DNA polymerase/3'-5' exonuclease PolX
VIGQDRVQEIPGIGKAIADIVKKLHSTGTHPTLEKMREEIPAGVLDMPTIPSLRADKVLKIYNELGILSLEALEEAAREGRLEKVKGLGKALQTKILQGLAMRRESSGKRHIHRAGELLKSAEIHLKEAIPDIIRVTPAGDFRRGCELVSDLSLVAEVSKLPGGPKAIRGGGQLVAHLTDATHYGITLLLATGSQAHLAALREVANKRSMTLEERGLCHGSEVVAAVTEEQIYRALGMQPIAPELREGRDEIARALAGTLGELVTDADIKGILHAHTGRSDGADTLETMAEATQARGYQYFGVADHSKSAYYAGGLFGAPGLPNDTDAYLKFVDEIYTSDAYHSLSIEGYRVTPELIERVRAGTWNPKENEADRKNRDALAARGYWQAFQKVKDAVAKIIGGADAAKLVREAHREWYRQMFQPCVAAGLIEAQALAGYRRRKIGDLVVVTSSNTRARAVRRFHTIGIYRMRRRLNSRGW